MTTINSRLFGNSRAYSKTRTKLKNYNNKLLLNAKAWNLPHVMQIHPTKGRRYISIRRYNAQKKMMDTFGFVR